MATIYQSGQTPAPLFSHAVALTASATPFQACSAIMMVTGGAVTIQFSGDSSPVTLTLLSGVIYNFSITVMSSGTTVFAFY